MQVNIYTYLSSKLQYSEKAIRSNPLSVRPFVFTLSFEPTDL